METSETDKLPHHDCIIQSSHFMVSQKLEKARVFRPVLRGKLSIYMEAETVQNR